MKTLLGLLALTVSSAQAGTLILDPGPGTQYLANWCGGQSINEYAAGFNADSTAHAILEVSARCSSGGRGGSTRTYYACWSLDFDRLGAITNRVYVGNAPCLGKNFGAVFVAVDGAVLSNVSVLYISGSQRYGSRALLTTP